MYRVVVPVDNDEARSRRQAEFVATLPEAPDEVEVYLTHVLRGEELTAPKAMRNPGRVKTVRDAKEYLEAEGITVNIAEAGLPPEEGIIDLAEDVGADMIVMGGRKRSPSGKALFGSVTQSVILDADCSVVVTGKGGD
ncbi:universal stress protein [Halobacteriaceae archaeon GCM10025711]